MNNETISQLPPPGVGASPTADEVARLLAVHHYRLTSPRRTVVDAVLARARPFTAEDIVGELAAHHPGIGRATIYRTLELLASIGVIARVLRPGGRPAYVTGMPGHRHHLVCSDCGETVAFSACPVEDLMRQLGSETAFQIQGHVLEIFGICPECQHHPATAVHQ